MVVSQCAGPPAPRLLLSPDPRPVAAEALSSHPPRHGAQRARETQAKLSITSMDEYMFNKAREQPVTRGPSFMFKVAAQHVRG